ncbi:MAG: DNA translocase FtsK 4TM domain-containing protein, partial [Planctomycetaceae bacterium]|nr:DNA translocase FtsK 4TM domain-containing protein [Planctomycetaceae bacterium]
MRLLFEPRGKSRGEIADIRNKGSSVMRPLGLKFIGIILLVLTVFAAVCLTGYSCADPPDFQAFPKPERIENFSGPLGAYLSSFLLNTIGWTAFLLFVPLGFCIYRCLTGKALNQLVLRTFGLCLAAAGICGLFSIFGKNVFFHFGSAIGPGGYFGTVVSLLLERYVASPGVEIFLFCIAAGGIVLAADIPVKRSREQGAEDGKIENGTRVPQSFPPQGGGTKNSREKILQLSDTVKKLPPEQRTVEPAEPIKLENYELPQRELLTVSKPFDEEAQREAVGQQAVQLEKVFGDFGYKVEVVDVTTGPVVSQFELCLAKGLRLNKITALSNDLGIAMKVPKVRIVAPIPGKNTVGVELPNEQRQIVRLRDVMELSPEAAAKFNIPIYLGKDVAGHPMVVDLAKMPHLLIAGRTGTGKSVCLNSIISSILMTREPEQVRMLMIDPKMVELSPYGTIPHLMHPVVTDMRKAEAILAWAVEKMEERYQLLASAGVRQLTEYNALSDYDRRRRMKML